MTLLTHIPAPEGVAPGNGFSHVVLGTGRFVAQARQVFENIGRCLDAAGATFADLVKLTFYFTDREQLPAIRAARDAVVDTSRPPASSAIQVAGLIRPEFLVEVDAYAILPD